MKNIKFKKYTTIEKSYDGLFDEPIKTEEVKKFLDQYKVDSLIVSGINADACVRSTVYGAIKTGYFVFSSNDLISNFNMHPPIYPTKLEIDSKSLVEFETLQNLFNYFK